MFRLFSLVLATLLVSNLEAFVTKVPTNAAVASRTVLNANNNREDSKGGFLGRFFDDLKGMGESLDDVVDDFVNKRMGAGEQWYGKRKYNPSGEFDEDYQGMGLSDSLRIDVARVQKEEFKAKRERERRAREERGY